MHSLCHSTPTFALLNDANPLRVQKMMRHHHHATTEIYVEEVQRLLEGASFSNRGRKSRLFGVWLQRRHWGGTLAPSVLSLNAQHRFSRELW